MFVNYSGWSEGRGAFSMNVFVDENRQDYSVEYGDGTIARQTSPFQQVTADWNNDGDIYSLYGAWFESSFGGNTFLSVGDLVFAAIEGHEKSRFFGNEIKSVHGIEIPWPEKKRPLEERLQEANNRHSEQADRSPPNAHSTERS